jgi:hypothetical protein
MNCIACSENQYRHLIAAGPFAAEELQAGQPRQPEIEDDGRIGLDAHHGLRFATVLDPVGFKPPLLQSNCEGITEQRVIFDDQHAHVVSSSSGDALDCPLPVGVDEMRAMGAENLGDSVLVSASVSVDIHDLVPLSEFRLVLPEVRSFYRPALQSAEHVCHTAAVDALGIDLSRAFLPRERSQVADSDPRSFERGDSRLRLPRIVNHGDDAIRQVSQGMSVLVRFHMASEDQPRMPV